MNYSRSYHVVDVDACEMCGNPSSKNRILGRRLDRSQGFRPKQRVGMATTVQQCNRCGLVYPNPLPIPVSTDQHYDVPPQSYWKPEYFQLKENYFRPQIERFRSLWTRGSKGDAPVALDIGAGIGKGMLALEKADFDTYGVEPSAAFRQCAIDRMGISQERIQLAAVENASFAPEMFDFINLGAVLEHVYSPATVINQALNWLKPGGLIHIEVPSASYLMNRLMRIFYRMSGTDYVSNISPMHPPYHLYEFTTRSFEWHGQRAGYRIAFHEYFGCATGLPPFLNSCFIRGMRLTKTGMQLLVWLQKLEVAATHPRLQHGLARSADR